MNDIVSGIPLKEVHTVYRCLVPKAIFLAFLGLPNLFAQEGKTATGEKILAAVEQSLNQAKTLSMEFDIVNQEPGKSERTLAQTVLVKGGKRLMTFTAPSDMAGTKILALSPTQMYIYLPAFGKVRRIATAVSSQGFMGMAFSPDDLFVTQYSEDYTAEVRSDAPKETTLLLTPKAGKTPAYSEIEMTLLKEGNLPTLLKFYDTKGVHLKTETRSGYIVKDGVGVPAERKMTDATKEGCWTRMVQKAFKLNENLSDDLFIKTNLEK